MAGGRGREGETLTAEGGNATGKTQFRAANCVALLPGLSYLQNMRKLIFCLVILAVLSPGLAHAWPGTMLDVPDGDTVVVAPSGDTKTPVKVRLYGVDAPELGQPSGPQARDWLRERLPAGTPVEVINYSQDKYGRVVGLIQIGSGSTIQTLNGELVAAGLAWVYWPYCKERFCRQWGKAEKAARADRRGLWQEADPTRPADWRKQHPRK